MFCYWCQDSCLRSWLIFRLLLSRKLGFCRFLKSLVWTASYLASMTPGHALVYKYYSWVPEYHSKCGESFSSLQQWYCLPAWQSSFALQPTLPALFWSPISVIFVLHHVFVPSFASCIRFWASVFRLFFFRNPWRCWRRIPLKGLPMLLS